MATTKEKREVPSLLRKCLGVDAYITDLFVRGLETFLPLRQLKTHYKMLEYSCHGIPWLAGWLAFILIFAKPEYYQMQVNLFIGLLLDILIVAVTKAITRRRRPMVDNNVMMIGPDKYSFPSGHASRATFIVYFFMVLAPVSLFAVPPMLAWLTSICLSRLLMRRHHILDVTAGCLLGLAEGYFIGLIYLDHETCASLLTSLIDERQEGAEYHV